MRLGKLEGFRRHFRDRHALLIDDLHFLGGKRATQEEFLHTLDALLAAGSQLVITCDCHPKLADEFTPELADRLLGGCVWGLMPPDAATRLEILRAKARQLGLPVPEAILKECAERLHGNVRELEGALHSLAHISRVSARPVDVDLAREALGELLRHSVRVVQVKDVEDAVCRALRLESLALRSKQRCWAVSHPRMIAMYLCRKHTTAAYSAIGQYFGGRNHSTAVAAEKKVRRWLKDGESIILGQRHLPVRDVIELAERELFR
jgi:chromosomal replication initiator protein